MRKSLLAVAALMGVGALPANAAMFRVDQETFANFGYQSQIWAQSLGKQTTAATDKSRVNFSINNAKVYFSGQVNKVVKFHTELDASLGRGRDAVEGRIRIGDAHIRLDFTPEFGLLAGYQRLPFSRQTLSSAYAAIIPTGYTYGRVAGGALVFESASLGAAGVGGAGSRDAGLAVFSNIANGMIVFRGGVFDGRYDSRAIGQNNEALALAMRIQFTPTMLGYKGETGYSLSDTYLGRQNVLTFAVGYNTQKDKRFASTGNTWKMLTMDAQWEQKVGNLIPSVQVGMNDLKDYNAKKEDARAMWMQGQLLIDQAMGLGKPALAIGYYMSEQKPAKGAKPKVNRLAIYFNYYIKGHDAKIQAGMDSVQRNKADKGDEGKNFTDYTLALQTRF
ncbi:MAG: hypothetical protein NZ526_07335 [Aquificaceae bacterium]|nr:hypothetical protein [Aquificaceae bacterium]